MASVGNGGLDDISVARSRCAYGQANEAGLQLRDGAYACCNRRICAVERRILEMTAIPIILDLLAAAGALLMAYHAWYGLRNYEQYWRWCITAELVIEAFDLVFKAFAL